MQIDFFGANCLRIRAGSASLVFDDNLSALGGRSVTTDKDVVCLTNDQLIEPPASTDQLVFNTPGAYEVGGIRLVGVVAQAHLDEPGKPPAATIYRGVVDSSRLSFMVTGHVNAQLSDHQLELIGAVNVLIVPVGGGGYTLDSAGAIELIKKTNPEFIIPTYYRQPGLKFPVEPGPVDDFLVVSGLAVQRIEGSLRVKRSDFGEQPTVVVLEPKN